MKYTANIYSLTSSGSIPSVILGYGKTSNSDLFILNLDVKRSYTSFSSPGKILVSGFEYVNPKALKLISADTIQSGDVIEIFENNVLIFTGYILITTYDYSADYGKTLTIEFDTLLSHFTKQNTIQSFKDVKTLSPTKTQVVNTDIFANKVLMSDLMTFLMSESIYTYVSKLRATQNAKAPIVIYNSPHLKATDEIFYYASAQSTKEQVLLMTTFFYQVMIYQDQFGNIVIDSPAATNKSLFAINDGDPSLRSYRIVNQQAALTNNVVVSLYYAGFFPPTETTKQGNLANKAIPNVKNFPRSNFLYSSTYFSQVELDVESLQGSIITDPVLLELLNSLGELTATTSKPPNAAQVDSTIGLLSQRYLAQALTFSNYVTIELQRNYLVTQNPIGSVVKLNRVPYYCVQSDIALQYGSSLKNTLTLLCVPIYSITSGWVN